MKGYYLCGDASQVLDTVMNIREECRFWLCRQIRITIQKWYDFIESEASAESTIILQYKGAKKNHYGTIICNRTEIEHSWVGVSTLRWTG